jgi:transposase-like protein
MGVEVVNHSTVESFFFQKRWPNGYRCPRCGHDSCYTIHTRRLPLYQCRLCKQQTTVTAGTIMDRSRTPLVKWAAAIDALTATSGVNAAQLATGIGVTHKVAWLMLRRVRRAISALEAERKLTGTVHAGLRVLGPYIFMANRHYRKERVVLVAASLDGRSGNPSTLKMTAVSTAYLRSGMKELNLDGVAALVENRNAYYLNRSLMPISQLRTRFDEAAKWLNRLFHGLGLTYLQSYLDEYCFRWNAAVQGVSVRELFYKICVTAP